MVGYFPTMTVSVSTLRPNEPPTGAVHCGLERLVNGQWQRQVREDFPRDRQRWWRLEVVDAMQFASAFGPGEYRVVWAGRDKRRIVGTSHPFVVEEHVTRPSLDEPGQPSAPGADVSQPQPQTQQPPAQPAAPAVANLNAAPPIAAQALHDPRDPLTQLVAIHALVHQDHQVLLARERAQHEAAIAAERARAERFVEEARAYYAMLDGHRKDLAQILQEARKAPPGDARIEQLAEQLGVLGEKLDRMAELDDDDQADDMRALVQQLSENPSRLEVLARGIQELAGAVAPFLTAWQKQNGQATVYPQPEAVDSEE